MRRSTKKPKHLCLAGGLAMVLAGGSNAVAGPVYQPPGSNLTFGDVTHGQRVQSASGNPAAAAADLARGDGRERRGTVLSLAAGLEYGNIQELFDFYDGVTGNYEPGEPGEGGGAPGQAPEDKPDGGIDVGDILDLFDPDLRDTLDAIAREVAFQTALLAVIALEGHAKAWVTGDAPFLLGTEKFGGAWTFGLNWSGTAKAFGIADTIDFEPEAAEQAILDWLGLDLPRPAQFPISDEILMNVDLATSDLLITFDNDSSMVTKASQTTEFNLGYSRQAFANDNGALYLGAEARLYLMRLSRLSVRFGDITDSDKLFDAIRDASFREDNKMALDVGALWVGDNYQIGAQITNVNEPKFEFPGVNLEPYRNPDVIDFLVRDQAYRMDRQLKLEASFFTPDRKWSAHIGLDADPATDPMGDEFQWATLSAGYAADSWWIPSARFGLRRNLAGTELGYVSFGATLFKYVNVDIASALDTVSINGRKLPQGLMGSIGFQISW